MVGGEEELLPQTTIGHYEIHRRVGAGGMGDVYAAEHKALGKRVAIKVLRRKFVDEESVVARFIREGKLAARLRHPHIVDVTDSAVIDGVPCLVMELLEGEALVDKIERENGVEAQELVDLVLPIVAALDHAHGEGVLHRDLKPGNVFLARGWNGEIIPKLLDFGISKSIGESATSAALTSDTGFLGTPRYAAPEVIRGGSVAGDARSDQYSFGLVLYEASTGEKPFMEAGSSLLALARAIGSGHTKRPREIKPEIPEELERVIRRAMAVLPEDRYPSMQALGAALLPLASERLRTIWEPVFADADPLVTTAATNVTGIASPAMVRLASAESDPPPASNGGATVVIPNAMTPRGGQGETLAMPRHLLTPRSGVHALPMTPAGGLPVMPMPMPSPAAAPAPNRFPFVAAFIGAVALLGAAVLLVKIGNRSQPVPAASAAPAPAASFEVRTQVNPETATLEIDGVSAGSGTITRSFPRDGKRHTLRASADGYEPASLEFDETTPPPPTLTLRAVDEPIPSPSASTSPSARPRPGASPPVVGRPGQPPARPGTRTDNIDPWQK